MVDRLTLRCSLPVWLQVGSRCTRDAGIIEAGCGGMTANLRGADTQPMMTLQKSQ